MSSFEYVQLQNKIPEPLCAFAGVYIPHNSSVLIFGGFGDSESRNIYRLNLESLDWRLEKTCETSLVGHSSVEIEGRMVTIGGWSEKDYSDQVFVYDPLDQSSKALTRTSSSNWDYPAGRRDHSLTLAENEIFLLGGWDSLAWNNSCDTFTKLWKLNSSFKWQICEVFGENPSTRRGHSTVYCSETKELVVFGGIYGYTALLSDLYVLHLKDMQWNKLNARDSPSKRAWHCAASVGQFMFVFGGLVEMKKTANDLFKFDMVGKTWHEILISCSPPGRFGGIMLQVEGFLIILGGRTSQDETLNDAHVLDIDSNYKNFRKNSELYGISHYNVEDIKPPSIPKELTISSKFEKRTLFDFNALK
jgi:hypothetical protein